MDNVAEEYPLPTAPTFPVMRHPDTRKWFAIIMDVPKDKLGLIGQQRVDVINATERIFQSISFLRCQPLHWRWSSRLFAIKVWAFLFVMKMDSPQRSRQSSWEESTKFRIMRLYEHTNPGKSWIDKACRDFFMSSRYILDTNPWTAWMKRSVFNVVFVIRI